MKDLIIALSLILVFVIPCSIGLAMIGHAAVLTIRSGVAKSPNRFGSADYYERKLQPGYFWATVAMNAAIPGVFFVFTICGGIAISKYFY